MLTAANLVRLTTPGNPRARLICFGYAGAGVAPFNVWRRRVRDEVELIAVRLPGRESLTAQAPLTDLSLIGRAVGNVVADLGTTIPIGLFGYCSGAFIAFEAARQMAAREASPSLLAVCSQVAPPSSAAHHQAVIHRLPTADLKEHVHTLGTVSPVVLDDDELWALLEPALRADFEAVETYVAEPEPKVSSTIAVFFASDDEEIVADDISSWGSLTEGRFEVHTLEEGGHFLLKRKAGEVLEKIEGILLGIAPALAVGLPIGRMTWTVTPGHWARHSGRVRSLFRTEPL